MGHEREYVLGTHNEELHRLGLQHRAWRARVLDAWAAGITVGSQVVEVVDLGCGPGYAIVDTAEVVGPRGEVFAVERSARFVAVVRDECARHGLSHVYVVEADLISDLEMTPTFDAVWCRWVDVRPRFLPGDPARLVRLAAGRSVIFHEYANYASWRALSPLPALDSFVAETIESFRDAGATADIATRLVPHLIAAGFEIVETKPLLFTVTAADFLWHWLRSFLMLREWNLDLLTMLDAAQWGQHGVHSERGIETIADTMALYAGHDLNHLRQIIAILNVDSHP